MIHHFGDLEVDTVKLLVRRAGAPVALKPRPFALLEYLIANSDRVVSKEDIIRQVWGGRAVSDGAIATAVRDVRKAIGDDDRAGAWLRTFYGRGLRWMAPKDDASLPTEPLEKVEESDRARLVAVMPFESFSDDAVDLRIAQVLTRNVIARLSRFGAIRVLSGKAVEVSLGEGEAGSSLAERMGAHYVVEGSLWNNGFGTQLDVQIGETATGTQLWADSHELPTEGTREQFDSLASDVVSPLVPAINANEAAKARLVPVDRLSPVGCYYRGRALVNTLDPKQQDTAIDLLERAVAADPNYAMAYAVLSSALCLRARIFGEQESVRTALVERARAMAERAMEIELDLPIGWAALARCHMAVEDMDEAVFAAQRAVALNPLLTSGYALLGHILWQINRVEEAIEAFDTGLRFGSRDVYRPGLLGGKACALILDERYEEAIDCSREAQREPGALHFVAVGEICGLHYLDRHAEAADARSRAGRKYPNFGSKLLLSTFPLPDEHVRQRILVGVDGASPGAD